MSATPEKENLTLPTLRDLAARYRYAAPESMAPRHDLQIDWEQSNFRPLADALQRFDSTGLQRPTDPPLEFGETFFSLGYAALKTKTGKDLPIAITKNIFVREDGKPPKSSLYINVNNLDTTKHAPLEVAGFNFQYFQTEHGEQWKLTHRIVREAYRAQGVAGHLFDAFEQAFQERAETTGTPQEISVDIAQADVLLMFLKRGYVPATEEDRTRINRFFSGDDGLTMVSSPQLAEEGISKDWYIFEKENLPPPESPKYQGLWQSYDENDRPHYLSESFRMVVKKEFVAA